MEQEVLDSEVKARIPEAQKKRLIKIANDRHLKMADIIREAIREKIELEFTGNGEIKIPARRAEVEVPA